MQYCVARAASRRPALAKEPPNQNEDEGQFLKWLALAAEFAKTLALISLRACSRMQSKRRRQKAARLPALTRKSD